MNNWNIGIHALTNAQMEKVKKNELKKNTVIYRIKNLKWDVEKAVSTPVPKPTDKPKMRTFIRAGSLKEMDKRVKIMERRGWQRITQKPVLDPANPYSFLPDSYVMVMEHPTLKREGTKTWGYQS